MKKFFNSLFSKKNKSSFYERYIPFHNIHKIPEHKINQLHIDTRDFEIFCSSQVSVKKIPDFFEKRISKFLFSYDDLVLMLSRLYDESGKDTKWRYLSLEGSGEKQSADWQMKYLHIHRYQDGFVVFNNDGKLMSVNVLTSAPIKKNLLNAH
jgi:hypothetical protein